MVSAQPELPTRGWTSRAPVVGTGSETAIAVKGPRIRKDHGIARQAPVTSTIYEIR
jgi:hypothetical protein